MILEAGLLGCCAVLCPETDYSYNLVGVTLVLSLVIRTQCVEDNEKSFLKFQILVLAFKLMTS